MKTNRTLTPAALFLPIAFALFTLTTSFKPVNAKPAGKNKETACQVKCWFYANTSTIVSASYDNIYGSFSNSNITTGTSWIGWALVSGLPSTSVNISILLGSSHPAGTLRIYQNGTLIQSYNVGANQPFGLDQAFPTACLDLFEIVW